MPRWHTTSCKGPQELRVNYFTRYVRPQSFYPDRGNDSSYCSGSDSLIAVNRLETRLERNRGTTCDIVSVAHYVERSTHNSTSMK